MPFRAIIASLFLTIIVWRHELYAMPFPNVRFCEYVIERYKLFVFLNANNFGS